MLLYCIVFIANMIFQRPMFTPTQLVMYDEASLKRFQELSSFNHQTYGFLFGHVQPSKCIVEVHAIWNVPHDMLWGAALTKANSIHTGIAREIGLVCVGWCTIKPYQQSWTVEDLNRLADVQRYFGSHCVGIWGKRQGFGLQISVVQSHEYYQMHQHLFTAKDDITLIPREGLWLYDETFKRLILDREEPKDTNQNTMSTTTGPTEVTYHIPLVTHNPDQEPGENDVHQGWFRIRSNAPEMQHLRNKHYALYRRKDLDIIENDIHDAVWFAHKTSEGKDLSEISMYAMLDVVESLKGSSMFTTFFPSPEFSVLHQMVQLFADFMVQTRMLPMCIRMWDFNLLYWLWDYYLSDDVRQRKRVFSSILSRKDLMTREDKAKMFITPDVIWDIVPPVPSSRVEDGENLIDAGVRNDRRRDRDATDDSDSPPRKRRR